MKFKNYEGDKPLTTEEKAEANRTFFTTIYKPTERKVVTVKPKWYEFWKKPFEKEELLSGDIIYNFLLPNTSFEIVHYDDDYLEIEVMGIHYPYRDEDIGRKDLLVIIDVTNEPYVVRAGQTLSLGYHLIRFEMSFVEILSPSKFRCKVDDFRIKVGIPQR